MPDQPVHRNILAVDIEGFGRQERDDPDRIDMREALFAVLAEGLELAGIDRGHWEQSDLGDGILVLISPEVSKVRLIDPLIGELTLALQRYNDTAGPAARMRLRAVVHAGEVVRHKQTYVGNDLNYAFRLLDSGTLRRWLADSTTDLALSCYQPPGDGPVHCYLIYATDEYDETSAHRLADRLVNVLLSECRHSDAWKDDIEY